MRPFDQIKNMLAQKTNEELLDLRRFLLSSDLNNDEVIVLTAVDIVLENRGVLVWDDEAFDFIIKTA